MKSDFIELFTDEALEEVPHVSNAAEALKTSRDGALSHLFEYRRRTTSPVSAWRLSDFARTNYGRHTNCTRS